MNHHLHQQPKIFTLGHRHTQNIFDGVVEITEKIDGSQFGFGMLDGELRCRSRKKQLVIDHPDGMFTRAVETVRTFRDKLQPNMVYLGEYLQKPKHNVLAYDRIPKNHIALFGAYLNGVPINDHNDLKAIAKHLGIDVVPLLYHGFIKVNNLDDVLGLLNDLLEKESFLGGPLVEGLVIKNYFKMQVISGLPDPYIPLTSAKYVSEKFKEKMDKNHKEGANKIGKFQELINMYKTDARWDKAIQHLKEDGRLAGEPKDIGPLIAEIKRDITEECRDEIMVALYDIFMPQILTNAINGFPEYFKQKLLETFNDNL